MKIIAVCNQKGGVGKTTLTRELGCYLASVGMKVLLVDADGQGNLTKSFFDSEVVLGLYDAIVSSSCLIGPIRENLDILPGSMKLALLEKQLVGEIDGYLRFQELFEKERFQKYDLILIDTPPSLGLLTGNALAAADHLLIPVSPAQYALQGTSDLLETVEKMKRSLNPSLSLFGVVVNAYNKQTIISRELVEQLRDVFGDLCFREELGRSIRFEEAIAEKKGLIDLKGPNWEKSQKQVVGLGLALLKRFTKSLEDELEDQEALEAATSGESA